MIGSRNPVLSLLNISVISWQRKKKLYKNTRDTVTRRMAYRRPRVSMQSMRSLQGPAVADVSVTAKVKDTSAVRVTSPRVSRSLSCHIDNKIHLPSSPTVQYIYSTPDRRSLY